MDIDIVVRDSQDFQSSTKPKPQNLIKMMKLVAFFALMAVAAARPAPGAIIGYSAPAVVAAAPLATTYTAVHTPVVHSVHTPVVHSVPAVAVHHAAPVVATYAAVPATHTYVSGVSLHAAPIEQHGYKIVY